MTRWRERDWRRRGRGAENEMSLKSLPPGYPGKFFVALVFADRPDGSSARNIEGQNQMVQNNRRSMRKPELSYRDGKGNFPSRATLNSPSTEVSTFLR